MGVYKRVGSEQVCVGWPVREPRHQDVPSVLQLWLRSTALSRT